MDGEVGSEVKGKSKIENRKSKIENRKSKIENRKSKIENRKSSRLRWRDLADLGRSGAAPVHRVELRGEAVGGDWLELPGGELVEAFFVGG